MTRHHAGFQLAAGAGPEPERPGPQPPGGSSVLVLYPPELRCPRRVGLWSLAGGWE